MPLQHHKNMECNLEWLQKILQLSFDNPEKKICFYRNVDMSDFCLKIILVIISSCFTYHFEMSWYILQGEKQNVFLYLRFGAQMTSKYRQYNQF